MTNAVNGMNGRKKAVSGFLMTMDGKSLSRRNDSEMYEIEPGCKTTTTQAIQNKKKPQQKQ